METTDPTILLEEIDNQLRRLKDQAIVDYKKELLVNCYPIIRMLVENQVELKDRLDLAEGAIAEALTHMESQILPDLAAQIQMALAIGLEVCKGVGALKTELPEELRATIEAYARAAQQVVSDVSEVTLVAIDDDDLDGAAAPPDGDAVDQALAGEESSR